jgi:hypothetical protein
MDEQNEKWNAEGMRSDRSNPEPSTPTRAASGHAGDEFEYGRLTRASFNLFPFAALLVEVIAFIILMPIHTTAPAGSCFSNPYHQWLARMEPFYLAALLMIPLGLILALVGYFMQRRQPALAWWIPHTPPWSHSESHKSLHLGGPSHVTFPFTLRHSGVLSLQRAPA